MRNLTDSDIAFVLESRGVDFNGVAALDLSPMLVQRIHFRDGVFTHTDTLSRENAIRYRAYLSHTFVILPERNEELAAVS